MKKKRARGHFLCVCVFIFNSYLLGVREREKKNPGTINDEEMFDSKSLSTTSTGSVDAQRVRREGRMSRLR